MLIESIIESLNENIPAKGFAQYAGCIGCMKILSQYTV